MASLNMAFGIATARSKVFVPKATKGGGSVQEEKGPLDWILGSLLKEDQLLETDPILNKVEGKSATEGSKKSTTSVSVPNKKKFGGFGGLFAKN
ncbi:uncharacterized protein LOC109829780 [Asparagus officinalis]|uniref:uncharacterized protein LOC109829780 n=1 Tax=Asparagus officinalis TaxID=4686 RepID=UPI00098E5FA0|nr:uncharacterized protein LOC109829780 [Asparagus officinalis]